MRCRYFMPPPYAAALLLCASALAVDCHSYCCHARVGDTLARCQLLLCFAVILLRYAILLLPCHADMPLLFARRAITLFRYAVDIADKAMRQQCMALNRE